MPLPLNVIDLPWPVVRMVMGFGFVPVPSPPMTWLPPMETLPAVTKTLGFHWPLPESVASPAT